MTQTSGLFPQISSNERLAIKKQLMPTAKPRVTKPKKRKVTVPQVVVEPTNPNTAVASRFGTPATVEGGTHERRAAARRKAGR